MATPTGDREERRRRIAERGSDRLALITGRIQNLPPLPQSPTALSAYHLRHESLPVTVDHSSPNHHSRHESLPVSALSVNQEDQHNIDYIGGDGHKHFAARSMGFRLKREAELPRRNNLHFTNEVEPLIENLNANEEENPDSVDDGDKKNESEGTGAQKAPIDKEKQTLKAKSPSDIEQNTSKTPESSIETEQQALRAPNAPVRAEQDASRTQKATVDIDKLLKLGGLKSNFFSSRELYLCIIASERLRAKCAFVIALLVVLIYGITESVEVLRPLWIVLLTDVTIVLHLLLEKGSASEAAEGEKVIPNEDGGDSWAGAVKLLERGLLAYQAMRGFFIDSSVYVVVVTCGTSFM